MRDRPTQDVRLSPLRADDDGSALKIETLAEAVDQVALRRKVHLCSLIGEDYKSRRTDARLRHVVNLHVIFPVKRLDETVQLARADAFTRRVVGLLYQLEQRGGALLLHRRREEDRGVVEE